MKCMTAQGPATAPTHPGNDAALQAAYEKAQKRGGTVPMPKPGHVPGRDLANAELARLAASHSKEHGR